MQRARWLRIINHRETEHTEIRTGKGSDPDPVCSVALWFEDSGLGALGVLGSLALIRDLVPGYFTRTGAVRALISAGLSGDGRRILPIRTQ